MLVVPTTGRPDLSPFEAAVDRLELAVAAPVVIQRLLSTIADPDSSLRDVEQVLAVDGALVARVLRLASSTAFTGRPVRDLRTAISSVGLEHLRRLAVTAHFAQGGGPSARALWSYSLAVAFTCVRLATQAKLGGGPDPFLCGLLHDIGTLVLDRLLGARYAKLALVPGDERQCEREQAEFGFDHADLGALAVARWNLFPELELVAQLHHQPLEAERLRLDAPAQAAIELVALARLMVLDVRAPRPADGSDHGGDELRRTLAERRDLAVADALVCGTEGTAQAQDVLGLLG